MLVYHVWLDRYIRMLLLYCQDNRNAEQDSIEPREDLWLVRFH
jgi:hypothetical protein